MLRETLDQDVGGAISHFFNCLVGPESVRDSSEAPSNGKINIQASSVSVVSRTVYSHEMTYILVDHSLVVPQLDGLQ